MARVIEFNSHKLCRSRQKNPYGFAIIPDAPVMSGAQLDKIADAIAEIQRLVASKLASADQIAEIDRLATLALCEFGRKALSEGLNQRELALAEMVADVYRTSKPVRP